MTRLNPTKVGVLDVGREYCLVTDSLLVREIHNYTGQRNQRNPQPYGVTELTRSTLPCAGPSSCPRYPELSGEREIVGSTTTCDFAILSLTHRSEIGLGLVYVGPKTVRIRLISDQLVRDWFGIGPKSVRGK